MSNHAYNQCLVWLQNFEAYTPDQRQNALNTADRLLRSPELSTPQINSIRYAKAKVINLTHSKSWN